VLKSSLASGCGGFGGFGVFFACGGLGIYGWRRAAIRLFLGLLEEASLESLPSSCAQLKNHGEETEAKQDCCNKFIHTSVSSNIAEQLAVAFTLSSAFICAVLRSIKRLQYSPFRRILIANLRTPAKKHSRSTCGTRPIIELTPKHDHVAQLVEHGYDVLIHDKGPLLRKRPSV
jgi:hypothetical protein